MDHRLRNVSELEKALQELSTNQQTEDLEELTNSNYSIDRGEKSDPVYNKVKSSSKHRTGTGQYGSNQLLYNMSGLQTTTNSKIDILIDTQLRTQQILQSIHTEQVRQTDLLAIIARNTASNNSSKSESSRQLTSIQKKEDSIVNYGFTNTQSLVAELIARLLKQVEIQVIARDHGYRTTRVLELKMVKNAVEIACKSEFKDPEGLRGPIKMPDNKNTAAVKLAEKIGAIDDLIPILDANALRELFNSIELRPLMSIIQDIIERICIIRIILPFYEADMINAITYPYFDTEGQIICNWARLTKRNETTDEAVVMNTTITNRKKIGTLLAKGLSIKTVLRAVIKESGK